MREADMHADHAPPPGPRNEDRPAQAEPRADERSEADYREAGLREADLREAGRREAERREAERREADLRKADLREAQWLALTKRLASLPTTGDVGRRSPWDSCWGTVATSMEPGRHTTW
jgi:hypothetical protein